MGGCKVILPDDVKSSHNDNDNDNDNDAALKADELLFEFVAQSCEVPAQIRTSKTRGTLMPLSIS
jgi:hypothetical protein